MAQNIATWTEKHGVHLISLPLPKNSETVDFCFPEINSATLESLQEGNQPQLIWVLGGDGTMIHACRHFGHYGVPLVGINHGRLGFLTDVADQHLDQALSQLIAGHYTLEKRQMLQATLIEEATTQTLLAVNDVYVNKGETQAVLEVSITVDGNFVHQLRADGLIVSSPTGSTAYALSSGGPIIHPEVQGLLMVAVAPHSLTNRPIVLPPQAVINLQLPIGRTAWLFADGHHRLPIHHAQTTRIEYAPKHFTLAHPQGYNYYQNLRDKLSWNKTPND